MLKKLSIIIMTFMVMLLLTGTCFAYSGSSVYRLCNPNTNEHLYTTDVNEQCTLTQLGWRFEGISWIIPYGGYEVYRLFNPNTGLHVYTQDQNEIKTLSSIGWYVDNGGECIFVTEGSVPIYRLFQPSTQQHLLTTDENEYNALPSSGWNQEGIAFYGGIEGNTNPINVHLSVRSGSPAISLQNRVYQIFVRDSKGYFDVLFGEYATGNSDILTLPFLGENEYYIQMKDQYPYYVGDFEIDGYEYDRFSPIDENVPLTYFYGD